MQGDEKTKNKILFKKRNEKFLDNLLNPPKSIEAGQVWCFSDDKDPADETHFSLNVLVLDTEYKETGVVRIAVVSEITNAGDADDVPLRRGTASFHGKRVVLRLTAGPVKIKRLRLFRGG